MQNRGRSRGRARSTPAPPGRSQVVSGPGRAAPAPAPVPSAWGPPRSAPAPRSQAPPQQQPQPGPSASGGAGDGLHVRGSGEGSASMSNVGRGAVRGRRVIPEAIVTRFAALTKQGTSGRPVKLDTNYFQMIKRPTWTLYHYKVSFTPEQDVTRAKCRLTRAALKDSIGSYIFDGEQLYTPVRMDSPQEFGVADLYKEGAHVMVNIRLVRDVQQGDFVYLQILNNLLRKLMGFMELQQVGRDFFDLKNSIPLANLGLDVWPGGVTSWRQHEHSILLLHETKFKVMRRATALDELNRCVNDSRCRNWKEEFLNNILNHTVLTAYNNKLYRIDDVDFNQTPKSTFKRRDGSEISYAQYVKERYGITLRNMTQPMLIHKAKERELKAGMTELLCLIPELCRMTGIPDEIKKDFHKNKELDNVTKPTPSARMDSLRAFRQRFMKNANVQSEMKTWDLNISESLVTVPGRQLPPELLHMGREAKVQVSETADWGRDLRSHEWFRPVSIDKWTLIYPNTMRNDVEMFVKNLMQAMRGMRIRLGQETRLELAQDRSNDYSGALRKVRDDANIVVCVMRNSVDRYTVVKKHCSVQVGIPSQVVTNKCFKKSQLSIATNVAIQMVTKVGGAPWAVHIPLPNCMYLGYDACHDPKSKSNTWGAFVASLDGACSAFMSVVKRHTDGDELSKFMSNNMEMALRSWKERHNGQLPAKILFYRDGVGESQLEYVYTHELIEMKKLLARAYNMKVEDVPFRFIVVNKRINTRFFLNRSNPGPGTIVDDVVTLPERSDFYLIAQCSRIGTVSPTYYSILGQDNFGLPSDKTQLLTYKLCHNYYNWSGTIKVPAPVQYAHKLAFQTSQFLNESPHRNLTGFLHYL